jgi:PTS system N-acetylglucosamine-specific IIC component
MKKIFGQLQRIGKALMLPIAILPAAALLLRFGAPDVLNVPFIMAAGSVIFNNLALLFAIGVAVGISIDSSGAAGLAGAVGYFVITNGAKTINPDINMGVLAGILAGLLAGYLYNRFHDIKLPDFLGFFGGKRFVSIVTGGSSVVLAWILGYVWPVIQNVIHTFGEWITGAGAIGVFLYGVCNQLLIPFGLHHVLNSLVWFVFGSYTNAAGKVVTGDLSRFFAGDPTAGGFMAGFFPIFMFAMPAAALAMYHTARPEQKKAVGGILLSAGLTFAITGVGEPLLFSFCFAAPFLFLIHALLTGSSLALCYVLGIKHGFGFSAGLIDYVLNFGLAKNPLMILLLGLGYSVVYYFLFRYVIVKFNIMTPGRETNLGINPTLAGSTGTAGGGEIKTTDSELARSYIENIGGPDNITLVEACITRLRLVVKSSQKVNESGLKQMGVAGILKANDQNVQIVVGTKAEHLADIINKELKSIKAKNNNCNRRVN